MLPCDNSVIGGDMLSNQKPCSCILIFLARLPISLGCFSVSHPQSCAERPEGPSLPCYTTTAATCTRAPRHTHSHRHTALLPPPSLQAGCLTNVLPIHFCISSSSFSSTSESQPLPFPSHLSSCWSQAPSLKAHTSRQLCHGNTAFSWNPNFS